MGFLISARAYIVVASFSWNFSFVAYLFGYQLFLFLYLLPKMGCAAHRLLVSMMGNFSYLIVRIFSYILNLSALQSSRLYDVLLPNPCNLQRELIFNMNMTILSVSAVYPMTCTGGSFHVIPTS